MSITSDELNFLVYRYLYESGFVHSSFVFASESLVGRSELATVDIPPGSLINFLQKGLQFVEIEKELEQHGHTDLTNGISLLSGTMELAERDAMDMDGKKKSGTTTMDLESKAISKNNSSGDSGQWVSQADVTELKGHEAEVLTCAWSPVCDILASGSGDSTVRVWTVPRGASGLPAGTCASANPKVLSHCAESTIKDGMGLDKDVSMTDATACDSGSASKNSSSGGGNISNSEDVTTLDWKSDGEQLATGSYDGCARIWSVSGDLQHTLSGHKGTIFSMKWSAMGKHLASGSVDKTAIVWDPASGDVVQKYELHTAPILDVDWKDDEVFATCSTDRLVYVCKVGSEDPVCKLAGHTDDVNAVKWSPSGELLASCSDDATAKIWKPAAAGVGGVLLHTLSSHQRDVYHIKWSPLCAPGSPMLATASFDTTIKLWDAETGKALHTLIEHTKDVYSVDFSPDGKFLASGSSDATMRIWSIADGKCIKKYRGGGRIFEVCWNKEGDKVAACFGLPGNCVSVIDFRK